MCDGNVVNTQILSSSINPKSLAGFIRTHIYGGNGGSNNSGGNSGGNCGGSSPVTSGSLHAATLATTCAVLMTDRDWRRAESFFDRFQQNQQHQQQQQQEAAIAAAAAAAAAAGP
jgi:hypothetical protein